MNKRDKKQQKKVEKKKAKRKLILAKKTTKLKKEVLFNKIDAEKIAKYPMYECLMQETLDRGITNILFSRVLPNGNIAASAFLVDVYCLGVKNAMYIVAPETEYNAKLKGHDSYQASLFVKKDPSYVRKLVESAVSYARDLGFNPHPAYIKACMIFGDVDPNTCSEEIEFGQNGKPFYISGPNENATRQKYIIDQLTKVCGPGGFEYLILSKYPPLP
jgi:hypothetical protein